MSPSGHASGAIVVGTFPMAPGHIFDRHVHDEHQLAWASCGVLVVDAEDGTWVLPPTRALWIPASVPHQVVASGRAEMRALYVCPDRCPINWVRPTPVLAGPLLAELVRHLDSELDPERRTRAEAVVIDLLEPVPYAAIRAPLPSRDGPAHEVADALLANPSDPRTLAEWGREVGASGRSLARAFVTGTGVPFGRWRTAARLQAALPRLAAGEPIAAVGRHVGYETPSAFVAAFRRETGTTPAAYFRTGANSS